MYQSRCLLAGLERVRQPSDHRGGQQRSQRLTRVGHQGGHSRLFYGVLNLLPDYNFLISLCHSKRNRGWCLWV